MAAAITVICLPSATPSAVAAPSTWCSADQGNVWDSQQGMCTATVASKLGASMNISIALPVALMENPSAGPVIAEFAQHLLKGWRHTGELIARDNNAGAEYVTYSASPALTSVVFHEYFQIEGTLANNAYRTFTFDLAHGRQLQLSDLFTPGVDPLVALPPLVRPYLIPVLDAAQPPHPPGTYPFVAEKWEPQPDGSGFCGDYKAFALTPDELILYMPGEPMMHENPVPRGQMVWSMDGGIVVVHVPRSALGPILRPL